MLPLRKIETVYTPEEYLEFERDARDRHEFCDGYVFKMAGESLSHSRICVNITREVSTKLIGKPCEALSSNMKVRTSSASLFAYPDLTVVCGEPKFHDLKKDVVVNPQVIFEVLSPSTERYDRGLKFQRYRLGNETLTDYILIAQETALIEHFQRPANNAAAWSYENYTALSDVLRLPELQLELALTQIYDRVELQQVEPDEREGKDDEI